MSGVTTDRYEALMDVVRNRMTNRAFAPVAVPREHFMYRDETKVD